MEPEVEALRADLAGADETRVARAARTWGRGARAAGRVVVRATREREALTGQLGVSTRTAARSALGALADDGRGLVDDLTRAEDALHRAAAALGDGRRVLDRLDAGAPGRPEPPRDDPDAEPADRLRAARRHARAVDETDAALAGRARRAQAARDALAAELDACRRLLAPLAAPAAAATGSTGAGGAAGVGGTPGPAGGGDAPGRVPDGLPGVPGMPGAPATPGVPGVPGVPGGAAVPVAGTASLLPADATASLGPAGQGSDADPSLVSDRSAGGGGVEGPGVGLAGAAGGAVLLRGLGAVLGPGRSGPAWRGAVPAFSSAQGAATTTTTSTTATTVPTGPTSDRAAGGQGARLLPMPATAGQAVGGARAGRGPTGLGRTPAVLAPAPAPGRAGGAGRDRRPTRRWAVAAATDWLDDEDVAPGVLT